MNKSFIKKSIVVITTLLLLYLSFVYILPKTYTIISGIIKYGINSQVDIPNNIPFSGSNINTGSQTSTGIIAINTGSQTSTGIIEKSLIEKLNNDYKKFVYKLPEQPTTIPAGYSYNQRSQVIVDYMSRNTLTLSKTQSKEAYIYIKILKSPDYPIFIYWHGSNFQGNIRSGDLRLDSAIEKVSDTEYIFDMSKIPYIKYFDKKPTSYNWLLDLNNGKSPYVALASKGFDGNYIKEVIIFTK